MSDITIYHNPRCSKSRKTLELLQANNIEPKIVLYLDNPPSRKELTALIEHLGITPRQLLRKSEDAYKEQNLKDESLTDSALVTAMLATPKLIERPIVVSGNKAVLGRPPENVLEII